LEPCRPRFRPTGDGRATVPERDFRTIAAVTVPYLESSLMISSR
jgi:hypothetical protein